MSAVWRLAWRGLLRSKGRSALIMAMIGLPVLAISAFLAGQATVQVDPHEKLDATMGRADAYVRAASVAGPVKQNPVDAWSYEHGSVGQKPRRWRTAEVVELLGPGRRVLPMFLGNTPARIGGGLEYLDAIEVDLRDPMTAGLRPLAVGRPPASTGEVAVTPAVLDLGVRLGDTITVTPAEKPVRIVGVVEHPQRPAHRALAGLPGTMLLNPPQGRDLGWLVDGPDELRWPEVRRLNQAGLLAQSRAVIMDPPAVSRPFVTGVGPGIQLSVALGVFMAVLEVVLLAGPAFTVGLRKRRAELAMVSAQGASPRHLRMIVLADGVLLGVLGSVFGGLAGAGLGLLGAAVLAPAVDLSVGPADVPWPLVAAVMALGVVSSTCAALVPALQAGRVARRDTTDSSVKAGKPALGLVLVATGVTMGVLLSWGGTQIRLGETRQVPIITAAVIVVLGMLALMPWLVARSGRIAGRLPLALRLPVRDAARHRVRTASAAAAVMAATTAAVTYGIAGYSEHTARYESYRPGAPMDLMTVSGRPDDEGGWSRVKAEAARQLPGVPLVPGFMALDEGGERLSLQLCQERCVSYGRHGFELPIGDAALLRAFQGRDDPAAAAALAEGKVVVLDPDVPLVDGKVTLFAVSGFAYGVKGGVSLPAVRAVAADPEQGGAVVPRAAADRAGYATVERVLHAVHRPADELRLERTLAAAGGADLYVVQEPSDEITPGLWMLFAAAGFFVLGGTLVATRLAAVDWRSEQETMAAIGAPRRLHRLMLAGQAAFIALLGSLAGLVVGGVTGLALTIARAAELGPATVQTMRGVFHFNGSVTFAVPWGLTAGVVVGLPLLAALFAGVFSRRPRLALSRRPT